MGLLFFWTQCANTRKAVLVQRGTHNSRAPSYASDSYISSVVFIRTAFVYSFIESPVKQNQSLEGARRPATKYL